MKSQDKTKKSLSHNVYYATNQYRIRIYRNDHKFYEKQLTLPKLTNYSISEEVKNILIRFVEKIGHNSDITAEDFYINEMLTKLNSAYLFSNLLQELRND